MSANPHPKSDDRPDQTSSEPTGPEPTLPGVAQPPEIETEEEVEGEESEEESDEGDEPKAKRRGRGKAKAKAEEPEAKPAKVPPAKVPYQELAGLLVENIISLTEDYPRESRYFVCQTALNYAGKILGREFVKQTKRAA